MRNGQWEMGVESKATAASARCIPSVLLPARPPSRGWVGDTPKPPAVRRLWFGTGRLAGWELATRFAHHSFRRWIAIALFDDIRGVEWLDWHTDPDVVLLCVTVFGG